MRDELFRPTMQGRPGPGAAPWRPQSIAYPAFFGGPLTAALLGVLNGRRLGLATDRLVAAGAAGLAGFLVWVALSDPDVDGLFGVRRVGAITGALAWLVVLAVQRKPFRAYQLRGPKPARLVWPGLAAVAGCGLLEFVVIYGLVR